MFRSTEAHGRFQYERGNAWYNSVGGYDSVFLLTPPQNN